MSAARWGATAVALALATALLSSVGVSAPAAGATPTTCAARHLVAKETAPGGRFAGRTPLVVASYNITGYYVSNKIPRWETRSGRIVEMILRCSPQVIGLQEASAAWMSRHLPPGQRNYTQYEQVVDLMNARTTGAPWRVTNMYRDNCRTEGNNLPRWNGRGWRTCVADAARSSGDNRTVYDSRVLTLISDGVRHLPSGAGVNALGWSIFEVKATGKRFVFANAHLDAWTGGPSGSAGANAFRRKQTAGILATLRSVRAHQGSVLPVVQVGDLNSTGRARFRTAVDDLTAAGYTDLLGTDRRITKTRRSSHRGSCRSVGGTTNLQAMNRRVPIHVGRRLYSYYNTLNAGRNRAAGTGVNVCMYKNSRLKRTRGARPQAYYRFVGVQLDYILATAPFYARGWETVIDPNLKRARYGRTPPSDHNLIAATLAF